MELNVIPLVYGTKIPIKDFNWRDKGKLIPVSLINTNNNGVGLPLGESSGVVALDLDYDIDNLHSKILKIAGQSPIRKIGEKGVNYFYRYNGEKKSQFSKDGQVVVDILGEGSYTVLPPSIHPNTKLSYKYIDKGLEDINLNELPYLPTDFKSQLDVLFGNAKSKANKIKSVDPEIEEALDCIDADNYETWISVGMALKNSYGEGSYELWDNWSRKSKSYEKNTIKVWESFKGEGLTVATVYKLAMEGGYVPDDTLYTVARAKKQMKVWKEEGFPVGDFIGIPEMENSEGLTWHLRKKEFTIITGKPNSGKSEFLDYMVYKSAITNGFKTLFVSFEKDPVKHIEAHIHRYTGICLEERSEEEDLEGERFVNEHFYFYNHSYRSNKIEDILKTIKSLTNKLDIDIIVIDPFSDLESDSGSAENNMEHVKKVCLMLSKHSKMLSVHIFLVAHPKSFDDKEVWNREKKKFVPATITMYSVSGGATFYNKCDNGIIIQRYNKDTEVKFLKIREQEHDKMGSFLMTYDPRTRRFNNYKIEF